jgi:glutamate carboxypeptidase
VVVKRKAAGTLKVTAHGAASHSGSAPDRGRNALLALAAAARSVAALHAPGGPDHLTAVPTIMRSGEAFNVVPASGELFCDLRADSAEAFGAAIDAVPREVGGARLTAELVRVWPGMDARAVTETVLAAAGGLLGRPILAMDRGGASDASHLAAVVPVTVDGLGPRGGGSHTPEEFIHADSLEPRAEVALAVLAAALD